jgi:hypothetical protein
MCAIDLLLNVCVCRMFVWVTIHLSGHPALKDVSPDSPDYEDKKNKIMTDLWTEIAEAKVLVAPGWMFAGDGLFVSSLPFSLLLSSLPPIESDPSVLSRIVVSQAIRRSQGRLSQRYLLQRHHPRLRPRLLPRP